MSSGPLPAIVLTAGLGTRLDPLTRLVAKAAVPMGERTLIERVLEWLRSERVTDLVLNLHHRPETITDVLGDGAHLGLRVRYSWEARILGSAGGPRRALSLLSADRVLIVNGDTLCPIDLAPMVAHHEATGADVTLAVIPNPAPAHYNGMVIDGENAVRAFVPKGETDASTWHFVGVQIAEARAFSTLGPNEPMEATKELYPRMIAERPGSVRAWPVARPFLDVGTPRDYLQAALAVAGRTPGTDNGLVRSIVWPEAHVPDDARLEECIVAGPVTLPSGFHARRAVLVPASVLQPGEQVETAGNAAVFPLH